MTATTAAGRYAEYEAMITAKIEAIQRALAAHKAEGATWGHVGSLAHVNEVLGELDTFIGGEGERP